MPASGNDLGMTCRRLAVGLVLVAAAVASLALSAPALGATSAAVLPDIVTPTAAPATGDVDGESGTSSAKPIASATLDPVRHRDDPPDRTLRDLCR